MSEENQQVDLTKGKEKDEDTASSSFEDDSKKIKDLGLPRKEDLAFQILSHLNFADSKTPLIAYKHGSHLGSIDYKYVMVEKRKFLEHYTEEEMLGSTEFMMVPERPYCNNMTFTNQPTILCCQCKKLFSPPDHEYRTALSKKDKHSVPNHTMSICEDCLESIYANAKKARVEESPEQGPSGEENSE